MVSEVVVATHCAIHECEVHSAASNIRRQCRESGHISANLGPLGNFTCDLI